MTDLKNNITIEASHIYFGGGFTLLLEALTFIENKDLKCQVYIKKNVVIDEIKKYKFNNVKIIKTSTFKTIYRYLKKRSNVLFFVNLPPFVKNQKSVLYFHNDILFNPVKFKHKVYLYWLKYFSKNVSHVACQTEIVKKKLENINIKKINIIPFYSFMNLTNNIKKEFTFCYVCSGENHKNIENLLDAFEIALNKLNSISIALTIEQKEENFEILSKIKSINSKYKNTLIHNLGLLDKTSVNKLYLKSQALIFPSLNETFGLPLIEANLYNLPILASDLPYVYELINNPIVFNPYDPIDISKVIIDFVQNRYETKKQSLKIPNNLNILIDLIS